MKTSFYVLNTLLALPVVGCTGSTTSQTADNTVLVSRQYPLPAELMTKFKNGPVKKFEQTVRFAEVAAVVKLDCTAIVLNPQNSVLTSINVILLKGAPSCSFSATADSTQSNELNEENMRTFASVTVSYSTSKTGTYQLENKLCEIYSQGTINVK